MTTALSILQTISVLAGLGIAYLGLNTWRRQRVEGRKIDIAEDALRGFARIKDVIFSVSNGAIFGDEKEAIIEDVLSSFPEERRDHLATYAAPLHRLNKHSEEIQKFLDQRYLCVAYFGEPAGELFKRVRKILTEIQVAAQMLVTQGDDRSYNEDTAKLYEELRRKIWMGSIDDHPLNREMVNVVDEATALFGKELRTR